MADQIFGDNKAPLGAVLPVDFADLIREVEDAEAMAEEANSKPGDDAELAALGQKVKDLRALWSKVDGVREAEKRPILEAGRGIDGFFGDLKARVEAAGKPLSAGADAYVRAKAAEARAKAQREAEEARAKAEEERRKAEAARSSVAAGRAEARAETLDARADEAEARAAASDADLVRAKAGGVTASAKGTWVAVIVDYQAAIQPLGLLGIFLKEDAVKAALGSMAKTQKGGARWPGVQFSQDVKATFR